MPISPPQLNPLPLAEPAGTLQFQWYAPETYDGAIVQYTLSYTDENGGSGSYPFGPNDGYAKITGLEDGLTYNFSMTATNDLAETSAPASCIPFQPGSSAPGIPVSVSSTVTGPGTILVTWTPPNPLPDATIFWYVLVSSSSNPSDPVVERTAGGTEQSLLVTGLNPGSAYSFSVTAVNCPGYGPSLSTVAEGPTTAAATEYVTDIVENIGPTTDITDLQTFLTGFTASNPAPTPVITEPSVLITTFVGNSAPGFDANTTYEMNFVLLTDNVATVDPADLTANSVLYFPMNIGVPISLVTPTETYNITTNNDNTITIGVGINNVTYNLGDYVTLDSTSFQVAFTGSAGLLVATPSPPSSGMVDLGVLSGGTSSIATAMSSNGSIVVGYGTVTGGGTRSFIYQSGTMTQLNDTSPSGNMFANGVSGDGSIIVGYGTGTGSASAFKYTGGSATPLDNLPLGVGGVATAISSDGTTIVGFCTDSGGQEQAVAYYSSGTTPTQLDTGAAYYSSEATAVSSDGSIIVGWGVSNISFVDEAFYVSGGTLINFGATQFAGQYSYATGVTADGTNVVGNVRDAQTGYAYSYGFVYTIGGSSYQIDAGTNIAAYATAGLTYTVLTGISADGSTIVGYATADSSGSTTPSDARAFKYTVSGTVYTDLGLLSGGFTALAKAISSNGSIIVGQAQTSGSELHAFKYTA